MGGRLDVGDKLSADVQAARSLIDIVSAANTSNIDFQNTVTVDLQSVILPVAHQRNVVVIRCDQTGQPFLARRR